MGKEKGLFQLLEPLTTASKGGAAPAPRSSPAPRPQPPVASAAKQEKSTPSPRRGGEPTVSASLFLMGGLTTNTCPKGSEKIKDATACQAAAKQFKLFYSGVETMSDYPTGCYQEDG